MTTITIGSQLGIESAGDLREQLLPHVRARRSLTVGIERIDRLHSEIERTRSVLERKRAGRAAADALFSFKG